MKLINQEILLRNPRKARKQPNGDATFLHQDAVFDKLISKITPDRVYGQNAEIIQSFTRTLVNVSNISVNILDFWNKEPLQQIVEPIDPSILEGIPDYKIYKQGSTKGFWLRSMINIQDLLCEMYLNNLYTTTNNSKHSYTLKIDIERLCERYGMEHSDKYQKMFDDVNELFLEDRFLANKEYNMKKGKQVDFAYMTKSAWDAKIEGPLRSPGYDYLFEVVAPLHYRIESVLLPQVFRSFVMPMAHPLGFGIDYVKVCKLDFEDDVFTKTRWRASAVSIKCTYPSDTSPLQVPGHNMPDELNSDWEAYNDTQYALDPLYDPFETYDPRYPGRQTPPLDKWISTLPWPGYIPNTESIVQIPLLKGPWDQEALPTEKIFATEDGCGLWEEISIDECQGNILKDIEYGIGSGFYYGMTFTKYIFENNNYLIQYECDTEDGKVKRAIEYFRFDVFEVPVYLNTIKSDPTQPGMVDNYPKNLINGVDMDSNDEMSVFSAQDSKTWDAGNKEWVLVDPDAEKLRNGLNDGAWKHPSYHTNGVIDTTAGPFPQDWIDDGPYYEITRSGDVITDDVCIDQSTTIYYSFDFDANAGQTNFYHGVSDNLDVYIDGLLIQDTKYSSNGGYLTLNNPLTGGEFVNIFERKYNSFTNYTNIDGYLVQFTFSEDLPSQSLNSDNRLVVFKNGKLLNHDEYEFTEEGETKTPGIMSTDIIFNTKLVPSDWIHVYELEQQRYQKFGKFGTGKITLQQPIFTSQVYIQGYKIRSDEYHTSGIFEHPVQTWGEDKNLITPGLAFAHVYALIGRWIEYRGCIVNAYDLEKITEQSITDELDIERIVLQRNIVHEDPLTGVTVNTYDPNDIQPDNSKIDSNIVNKFQKVDK